MTYPWIVLLISALFALLLLRQYRERRKSHQLIWALSLSMSAVGTLSYILAVWLGGYGNLFRLYYLFGAMLAAPLLGLGSLHLVASPRVKRISTWTIVILSLVGTVFLFLAPMDESALHSLRGGPGTHIIMKGAWLPILILLNTFGAIAVAAIALVSAWRIYRKRDMAAFGVGNILIAIGTFVLASAGTAARMGKGAGFWLVTAAGWAILFAGFRVIAAAMEGQIPAKVTTFSPTPAGPE